MSQINFPKIKTVLSKHGRVFKVRVMSLRRLIKIAGELSKARVSGYIDIFTEPSLGTKLVKDSFALIKKEVPQSESALVGFSYTTFKFSTKLWINFIQHADIASGAILMVDLPDIYPIKDGRVLEGASLETLSYLHPKRHAVFWGVERIVK